ncbi:hypothetical protein LDENG_00242310 [Lucifuga dentata]|nr:hypothetical protein LDENG_00242310 [Lucifuga dentata]
MFLLRGTLRVEGKTQGGEPAGQAGEQTQSGGSEGQTGTQTQSDEVEKQAQKDKTGGQTQVGLETGSGQLLNQPGDIRRQAVDFYSELYNSKFKNDEKLFSFFCDDLPHVLEESNLLLRGPLLQELSTALQNGLHWVPQSKLFLLKEEGGQGLIHLASRVATFRLQFVQRFLTGPANVVWRPVASSIFKRTDGLGLDSALFLMNPDCFNLCNLSVFYQNLFKTWTLFTWSRLEPTLSLHWLLEEPLVHGARLDVQDLSVPGLTYVLCSTANITLRRIVDMAGPDLKNTAAVALALGQRSTHLMDRALSLWIKKLIDEERIMLQDYCKGVETPDESDPFPELGFTFKLNGAAGLLFNKCDEKGVDFYTVKGKVVCQYCVKALNKNNLSGKEDTVWRERLKVTDVVQPV